MPEDIPKWNITTSEALSTCAQELWALHHIASDEIRGWDINGAEVHKLQVHSSDPDSGVMAVATVGTRLMLLDGTPKVISAAELAAWGI